MEQMARDGMRPDLVFLDPPRAGSDERFLRSLLRCAPEKVVYVSCDPETLARDLALLAEGGYRVQKLQPVDMFPYTKHIECVCLLSRSKPEPAGGEKKRYQSGNREEAKEPSAAGKSFPPRGKRKRKEHGNGHNVDTKTL